MRKAAIILSLVLLILIGFSASYESETDSSGERSSNLEDVIYDEQGTYAFQDGNPSQFGPHWYYGSQVVEKKDGSIINTYEDNAVVGGGSSIINYYVNPQDGWGQGEEETTSYSNDTFYAQESDPRTGFSRVINRPYPSFTDDTDRCGSLSVTNDNTGCPEDSGLPGTSSLPNTVSENLNQYTISEPSGQSYTNDVVYEPNAFNAFEFHTEGYIDDSYVLDATGNSNEVKKGFSADTDYEDDSGNIDTFNYDGYPGFYRKPLASAEVITSKYVDTNPDYSDIDLGTGFQEIGSVTSDYLVTKYHDTTKEKTIDTCDDSDSNYTSSLCDDTGETAYSGRSIQGSEPTWELNDKTETITGTANHFTASEDTGSGWDGNIGSKDIQIDVVTDNAKQTGSEGDYYDTSGSQMEGQTCDTSDCEAANDAVSGQPYDCSCTGGSTTGYVEDTDGYEYETVNSHDVRVFIERLEWAETDILSTDVGASINIIDLREAIFDGYNFDTPTLDSWNEIQAVSVNNQGYLSTPRKYSENNPNLGLGISDYSSSITSYRFDTDGNQFIATPLETSSYKPDGGSNLKSGYVAIEHEINYDTRGSNFNIVGTTPNITTSGPNVEYSPSQNLNTDYKPVIKAQLENNNFECPDDSVYCVVAVDPYLEDLGSADEYPNTDSNWNGGLNPNQGVSFRTQVEPIDASLGVCKLYQSMTSESDIDDGQYAQCEYDDGPGGGPEAVCNEAYNRWHRMEGPEVNDLNLSKQSDRVTEDYQGCVEVNECVLHGNSVSEGTVANVAFDEFDTYPAQGYETGTDSPDWEVCLNINSDYTYNNYYDPNDDSSEFGGQWYDLDNRIVQEYLKGNTNPTADFTRQGDEEALVSGADTTGRTPPEGADNINQYWRENPFPYHATYNPQGGEEGTNILSDCAPGLKCGEENNKERDGFNNGIGYYSFFKENSYDDDKHPQGIRDNTSIEPVSEGVLTMARKHPDNEQLDQGSDDYSLENPEWFEDTEILDSSGDYSSIAMAYGYNKSWTVDSAGASYPAYGSEDQGLGYTGVDGNHYIPWFTGVERTDPQSSNVVKTSKAFGNSIAVVANQDISGENGQIEQGEGFWIDPDNIREHVDSNQIVNDTTPNTNDWRELVNFHIDLTGPDSGLGWDYGWDYSEDSTFDPSLDASRSGEPHPSEINFSDGGDLVYTDIHWEEDQTTGDRMEGLQPPMCGDDSREYLLEEMGESINSPKYDGRYACATSQDYCVSYEGEDRKLFDNEDIINTNEPGESVGRLKNDQEVCADQTNHLDLDQSIWFDQDYANSVEGPGGEINLCRENDLYGSIGVSWINSTQINNNPVAFRGGVDDSWNERLSDLSHSSYEFDLDGDDWNIGDDIFATGHSPIPTGVNGGKVANSADSSEDYGFCGGDDASEYLIYQKSQTKYIDTDQSIIGVAASPDSCVLNNSHYSNIESDAIDELPFNDNRLKDERMLYDEGDSVEFDSGDTRRTVACFGGEWWGEWPIVFLEDVAEVNLGETGYTSFRIINPDQGSKTFDLGINPRGSGDTREDLDQMVSFEDTGTNDMTVTVPGESSNTYRLEIQANREINTSNSPGTDIEVFAESSDGSLDGQDQVDIVVNESNTAGSTGQSRSIPGLTLLQLAVIAAVSSLVFFRN